MPDAGAGPRGDQHADNIAARIDGQTKEIVKSGVVTRGCSWVITKQKERSDNCAIYARATKCLGRVIAHQNYQEGEQAFAEHLRKIQRIG